MNIFHALVNVELLSKFGSTSSVLFSARSTLSNTSVSSFNVVMRKQLF